MGVIGKTDRVDARMLAEFGARLRPTATEPLDPARRALQAQATRRRQLVALRKQEATRLQQTADAEARADIKSSIALLDRRIAKADSRMRAIVEADAALAKIDRQRRTVPADRPDRRRHPHRRAARTRPPRSSKHRRPGWLGADRRPADGGGGRDSGKRAGRRTIGGARPVVRTMLFIAGLHASRRDATFRDFRLRLEAAGKPVQAAITATARKLLIVLDAMLAAGTDYQLVTASPEQLLDNPYA